MNTNTMVSKRTTPAAAKSGNDTRERILRAAETLFSKNGFDAVSMQDIAERAGVSKANVFHHFDSKNDLYLAVLRACCDRSSHLLEELISEPAPVAERLARFAQAHLQMLLGQEQMTRLIQREVLKGNARRGEELAQQIFGDNFARFVDVLRQAQAGGELRADVDPALIAVVLLGADVFFFEAQSVLRHFRDVDFADDPARYSRMLIDIILKGILLPTDRKAKP